jgi:hypothetical protein
MERRGAGGTPGGLVEFFVGLALLLVGLYMIMNRVTVAMGFWTFGGFAHPFGVMLVPLIAGIGTIFYNGRSILGWVLTIGTLVAIVLGVLMNLNIYFQQTGLVELLVMVGAIAAGLGLMLRGLRPH